MKKYFVGIILILAIIGVGTYFYPVVVGYNQASQLERTGEAIENYFSAIIKSLDSNQVEDAPTLEEVIKKNHSILKIGLNDSFHRFIRLRIEVQRLQKTKIKFSPLLMQYVIHLPEILDAFTDKAYQKYKYGQKYIRSRKYRFLRFFRKKDRIRKKIRAFTPFARVIKKYSEEYKKIITATEQMTDPELILNNRYCSNAKWVKKSKPKIINSINKILKLFWNFFYFHHEAACLNTEYFCLLKNQQHC